jgi:hypothetical protein
MTSTNENITIGQEVLVKIAGRIISAIIEETLPDGWMVKSIASGKTFKTRKLQEQPANEAAPVAEPTPEAEPAAEPQPAAEEEPEAPEAEPAPEAPRARKMSLLDAAIEVLKLEAKAMNTRDMVKQAIERGLWVQTSCKTPEQTLYGAIFREIKESEHARIRKSEKRGLFEYAG